MEDQFPQPNKASPFGGINTKDIKLKLPIDPNGNKSHSQNDEIGTTGEGQLLSLKVSVTASKQGTNKDKQDVTPPKSKDIKDFSDVPLEKSSIIIIRYDPENPGQDLRPEVDGRVIPSNLNLSVTRRIENSQRTNPNQDPASHRDPLPLQTSIPEVQQNSTRQARVAEASKADNVSQSVQVKHDAYQKTSMYGSVKPYAVSKQRGAEDVQGQRYRINEKDEEKKGGNREEDSRENLSINAETNYQDYRHIRETPGAEKGGDLNIDEVNNVNRMRKNSEEDRVRQNQGDDSTVPIMMSSIQKTRALIPGNKQTITVAQNLGDSNSAPNTASTLMKSQAPNRGDPKKEYPYANIFPYMHFMGENIAEILQNDIEYHNIEYLKAENYRKHEIEEVINPCLGADGIDQEVKHYLMDKKKELELLNLQTGFSGEKEADKMHKANKEIYFALRLDGKLKEMERVKERLRYAGITFTEDGFIPKKNTKDTQEKNALPQTKPPIGNAAQQSTVAKMFQSSMNMLFKKCSFDLEKRILQYKALSIHMTNNVIPYLEEPEKSETRNRVKTQLEDKIVEAEKMKNRPITGSGKRLLHFLKEVMKDLDPEVLHGKSVGEKGKEITLKIELIEQCIKQEETVLNQITGDKDSILQSGRMITEINDTIAKYNDYIKKLKELLLDKKSEWVFVPRIKTKPIYRTIIYQSGNINPNTMVIQFQKIESKAKKAYFIQSKVDGAIAASNKVVRCDKKTQLFNDTREVKFSDTEMKTIYNKTLQIELFSSSFSGCLESSFTTKHGVATISLQDFQTKYTISGTAQLPNDTSLTYILRIPPQVKETELKSIDSFINFTKFVLDVDTEHRSPDPSEMMVSRSMPKNPRPAILDHPLVLIRRNNDPLALMKPNEAPEGFTLEEILEPDNPQIIYCYRVLENMEECLYEAQLELKKDSQSSEYEVIKEKYDVIVKKAEVMHGKIHTGNLDVYTYMGILEQDIQRSRKLELFYERRKESKRCAFVREKIRIMETELETIKQIFRSMD